MSQPKVIDFVARFDDPNLFLTNYQVPLRPVKIGKQLTENWLAHSDFVDHGAPHWQFWQQFKDEDVTVWIETDDDDTVRGRSDVSENLMPTKKSQEKWKFGKFLDMLRYYTDGGKNNTVNVPGRPYVKDWHFFMIPKTSKYYSVPEIFSDDWLNKYYLAEKNDDFRFVYFGAANSSTDRHYDVYYSHSWSCNILGVKHWQFWDPNNDELYVCKQYPGESVFVPSGWQHTVRNEGITISINHNWANSSCIENMKRGLSRALKDAEESIRDLLTDGIINQRRFHELALEVTRANFGWDESDLKRMIDLRAETPGRKTVLLR